MKTWQVLIGIAIFSFFMLFLDISLKAKFGMSIQTIMFIIMAIQQWGRNKDEDFF